MGVNSYFGRCVKTYTRKSRTAATTIGGNLDQAFETFGSCGNQVTICNVSWENDAPNRWTLVLLLMSYIFSNLMSTAHQSEEIRPSRRVLRNF